MRSEKEIEYKITQLEAEYRAEQLREERDFTGAIIYGLNWVLGEVDDL